MCGKASCAGASEVGCASVSEGRFANEVGCHRLGRAGDQFVITECAFDVPGGIYAFVISQGLFGEKLTTCLGTV